MNNNYNENNFNEEMANETLEPIKEKGSQKVKQAIGRLVKRGFKALRKLILMLLKVLLPYILVIGGLILTAIIGYFLVFEFRGTEKEYTQRYENQLVRTDDGKYIAEEKDVNAQNKIIRDFYLFFSGQSYWQLLGKDNTTLITPDGFKPNGEQIDRIEDYYKREDLFKLNPNFLFSLDEYMYKWQWKYPEQMIKPVHYDTETLTLKPLVDENGFVIAESEEENVETGEKTGNKILSVRDYGLGSVLKYNEKDDYKRTLKIKGTYTEKDVWDENSKSVVTVKDGDTFELEIELPESIYLIDKAILFNGEIEYEYEYKDRFFSDLTPGQTEYREEKQPKLEYFYDIHKEPIYDENGQIVDYEEYKLYKYRDGAIFENLPVVVNVITKDKGYDYFEDFLYNFESYIPIDAVEDFEFEDRIDYDSYIFDYKDFLTDDYGFNLGSAIDSKAYEAAFQYFNIIERHSAEFGVDPYIILAMIAQESSGNPNINSDGLLQITDSAGKTITTTNIYGETQSITVEKYERKNPEKAIRYGVMKFKNLLDEMDGDPYKAIQAYNFGTGTMKTLKNMNPEAWNSGFGWLIYREGARRKHAPPGKASASYDCMNFPEGRLPSKPGNLWGNSCHLENVLRYYGGGEMPGIDTSGEPSAWDRVKSFGNNLFKMFIPERNKSEPIPKVDYKYYARDDKIFEILRTTSAMDRVALFSEANNEYTELSFWEDGFMDSMASIGMSLQEILDIAPNPDGYLPPIIVGRNGARVTSYFGPRVAPKAGASTYHKGVDIGAPQGTHVYAIADGVVTFSGMAGKAGNMLKINHGEVDGKTIETVYMHLHRFAVEEGDRVKQGQMIAEVGNTGNSTGAHLHFEFKINGNSIDPLGIILGE